VNRIWREALERDLGCRFLVTRPLPGLEMDRDGLWHWTEPI